MQPFREKVTTAEPPQLCSAPRDGRGSGSSWSQKGFIGAALAPHEPFPSIPAIDEAARALCCCAWVQFMAWACCCWHRGRGGSRAQGPWAVSICDLGEAAPCAPALPELSTPVLLWEPGLTQQWWPSGSWNVRRHLLALVLVPPERNSGRAALGDIWSSWGSPTHHGYK